jgi:glutamate-1-semialdehyde aminotransferase
VVLPPSKCCVSPGRDERLHQLGQQLRDILHATLREHHVAGQVLGDGPLYHVVFTPQPIHNHRDMLTGDTKKQQIFHRAPHHGVLKPASKGYISLLHSAADVAETTQAFDAAMAQVARS